MAGNAFDDPRIAALYDPLDPDRPDLDVYAAIVDEFGAMSVLDVGCGTGSLACLLAGRGKDVVGVDPSSAMIDVARNKRDADRARWLVGDAPSLPALQVDTATMTGNVAQVFLTDDEFAVTLRAISAALRPGGRLVFETLDPANEAWRDWTRERSYFQCELPDVGRLDTWEDLVDVNLSRREPPTLHTFRSTIRIKSTGEAIVALSTLRFWTRHEVAGLLQDAAFTVDDVRDAPDRPGCEFVFIAHS